MNNSQIYYNINFSYSKSELISLFLKAVFVLIFAISLFYLKESSLIIFLIIIGISISKKKSLEFIILLTLILATNVFEFGNLEDLPNIQLGPGLRLNSLDILIVFFSLKSFIALKNESFTASMKMINFYILISFIYVVVNFILTGSPKEAGTNYLRVLIYPAFFYVYYEYFKEANNIKRLLTILSLWVIIFVLIQAYEYLMGYRLTLPGIKTFSSFYTVEGEKIISAGQTLIYTWSRTTMFSFIMLGIGLALFYHNKSKFFLITSISALFSFFIAVSRIWIVGAFIMFLVISLLYGAKRLTTLLIPLTIIILISSIFQFLALKNIGIDFLSVLYGRSQSILSAGQTYGEMDTLSIRILFFNEILKKFLESPIWGWGFGQFIMDNYYFGDLGLPNRFLLFGLIGTIPFLLFLLFYPIKLLSQIKNSPSNNEKALMIGVMAVFIAHFLMYVFQIEFWGSKSVISLIMIFAIGDRILQKINGQLFIKKNKH